jgi:hypothetical protein
MAPEELESEWNKTPVAAKPDEWNAKQIITSDSDSKVWNLYLFLNFLTA